MRYTRLLIVACIVGLIAGILWAEKVDLRPDQLRQIATHIVVGKVIAIYERKQDTPEWKYVHYVAEVGVEQAEKGGDLKTGDLVYVRYWKRYWKDGKPRPSTSGHRGLPAEGDTVRIYLARNAYDGFISENNDGGYNVIGANGFEAVAATPATKPD